MKRAVRLCKRTASVTLCLSFAWLFALPANAAEPAAGTLWVEPNTKMEFAWIPSGCFLMGSHLMESEKPEHIVCLKGFWMGRTEVTQSQYSMVTGQNPSQFHGEGLPVDSVSWQDANELTINTGRTEPYNIGDGYGHLALSVADLEAEHSRLTDAGLAPRKIVNFAPAGSVIATFFFIADPDGYQIEVLQRGGRYL